MPAHLWPLLRLKADSEAELKEKYRQIYIETYVKSALGEEIFIYDWHGVRVRFHAKTFDHAFFFFFDYRFGDGYHDKFSKKRARCILWIKEVLSASRGTIECINQMRRDSRNRLRKRRVLIVVEEKYVVVLQATRHNDLEFVTAYPASEGYIRKIRRDGTVSEIKKPQSYGD